MSESAFFQDLAILMTVAGFMSVVCARFNWPKVIGYIFAGVVMSPYTWGGSFLSDAQSVQTIGQLGVVFLMFAMGLDFSTSDMKRLKSVTLPVALLDTIVMTWLGYTVGTRVLGWGAIPSIFLGAAICDSATTMLAKVIDELKWNAKGFVKYTLGTSVCEDIVCVGIIAVITGVAGGKGLDFRAACYSMGGLSVFFLAVLTFGLVLVPRLLASVAKRADSEVLLLTILGCLFFVSFVAYRFDFSLALGAFLVGIIGAASQVRKRLAELAFPLRSMFAAVFFISIGYMVNPGAWLGNLPAILLLTSVVIVGKFVNCSLGAVLCGERVKTAVQMGMSLAQIGEFAFMVAILYLTSTRDTTSPMYQIVVATSILTTLLNPFFIRRSEAVGEWVERKLPGWLTSALDAYRGFVEKYRNGTEEAELRQEVKRTVIRLGVLAALLLAFSTACGVLFKFDYSRFSEFFERHDRLFFFLLVNVFALVLAPMVLRLARTLGEDVSVILVSGEEQKWQQSLRHLIALVITIAVIVGFFIEASMINVSLAPDGVWTKLIASVVLIALAVFGWRFFAKAGHRASERFLEALSAEERRTNIAKALTYTIPEGIVHRFTIDLASPAVGGSVVTLDIRAKTGASIISVERDGEVIRNVGPEIEFAPGDILIALGDSSQIAALKDLLGVTA